MRNIAEILKDCPKGMELDCLMYEDVYFDYVDELNIIHCYIQYETHKTSITFNQHGTPNSNIKSKCVIFPKDKTTWEGFVPPCQFKNGDIIYNKEIRATAIFYKQTEDSTISHCFLNVIGQLKIYHYHSKFLYDWNLATEEEKQKLFDAIKAKGYKWNEETKTLEKLPKFKVGDRVKHISAYTSGIVVKVSEKGYHINYPKGKGVCYISFTLEKDYELVLDKFNINTLKPFESKVLVRHNKTSIWMPAIFGGYMDKLNHSYYAVGGTWWEYCIPYEGNEHLLGTNNDCDDYYKTWKK